MPPTRPFTVRLDPWHDELMARVRQVMAEAVNLPPDQAEQISETDVVKFALRHVVEGQAIERVTGAIHKVAEAVMLAGQPHVMGTASDLARYDRERIRAWAAGGEAALAEVDRKFVDRLRAEEEGAPP